MNKKKIINDPVYGFISINSPLIFDLVEHPYLQRLRHIRQLGLADLVYPGALHTRFHHALGAMHLMGRTLDSLRAKGIDISGQEYEAAQIAILLHDIGHGPFSHTLEETLLPNIKHESVSFLFMKELNQHTGGELALAMKIFQNTYTRKFFHQLVSSQLDIDRLDYLTRDSFFTGVTEGAIGVDRIISMLNVKDDQIVVDEKGINSIEHFLNARRLMYWQVYLHKTSVSAERLLVNIMRRAQYVAQAGEKLTCTEALKYFLKHHTEITDFKEKPSVLKMYGRLDDNDIWGAVKLWCDHRDRILALLCQWLLERKLFQIRIQVEPIAKNLLDKVRYATAQQHQLLRSDTTYLLSQGTLTNEAYVPEAQRIGVWLKSGEVIDIAQASDLPGIKAVSKIVKKNYLCWPKHVSL